MFLTAYLDESGTHENSPVIVVAGMVGYVGQWTKFEKKWRRMLHDSNLEFFHAKELVRKFDKQELIARADKLTSQYALFQFIASLKVSEYKEIYKPISSKRPKGMGIPDSMYGLCFRYAMSAIPRVLEDKFGQKELNLNIVMEAGHRNSGDAERIFREFKRYPKQPYSRMLGLFSLAEKKECFGVQAADCLAYAGLSLENQSKHVDVVVHNVNEGFWANAKNIANSQSSTAKPNFRLQYQAQELIEMKIKLLNTVKPKWNGTALWEQEKAAKLAELQPQ